MTKKPKETVTGSNWPPREELEKIMRKCGDSDYPYVNYLLPENPTSEQRIKYGLCKVTIRYEKKNLSFDEIVKMLGISGDKLIDIIYISIDKLSLEELMTYVDKLRIPFKIRTINNTKPKKTSREKLSSKESKN